MAIKEIVGFSGIRPRENAALLRDSEAQIAENCDFRYGDLRPIKEMADTVTPDPIGDTIRSIYRMGQQIDSETQYWLAWTADVDVVAGMVSEDTSERTYFTGDGAPKVTNLQMATQGGTAYPVATYLLGIPKPTDAPICTPSSNAAPAETRIYVYTYVSAWGEEGPPSPFAKVDVSQDGSVDLSGMSVAPDGAYNIATKRIYRAQQTDTGAATLLFVDEIQVAQATYTDSKTATELGEEISTTDYSAPPTTMAGMKAMPNGIAIAFDGYDLLFSEPYKLYAWPQKYRLTCDFPIVGIGVFGSSAVVVTKGAPYLVTGTAPENMSMDKMAVPQACVSKRSIVECDDGVIYASPNGLVYVGAGGAQVITSTQYTAEQWQALNPETLTGFWHKGRYIGAFDVGGGFILDAIEGGRMVTFTDTVTAGYVDKVNDALYLCVGGVIKKFEAGSDHTYTWRSRKIMHNGRTPYAFGMVDADSYPITLNMYWDGALTYSVAVESDRPFALPGGDRPRTIELELSGIAAVRYLAVADSVEEMRVG